MVPGVLPYLKKFIFPISATVKLFCNHRTIINNFTDVETNEGRRTLQVSSEMQPLTRLPL